MPSELKYPLLGLRLPVLLMTLSTAALIPGCGADPMGTTPPDKPDFSKYNSDDLTEDHDTDTPDVAEKGQPEPEITPQDLPEEPPSDEQPMCALTLRSSDVKVSEEPPAPPLPPNPLKLNRDDMHEFDFYDQYFVTNNASGRSLSNLASNYQVETLQLGSAQLKEGQTYWKLIGIHHLLPSENKGKGLVYVEVLDEKGKHLRDTKYYGESLNANGNIVQFPLDKKADEPYGNFPFFQESTFNVKILGSDKSAPEPSDSVLNLHARHAEEPIANGEILNGPGRHSFYLVFQRTKFGSSKPKSGKATMIVKGDKGRKSGKSTVVNTQTKEEFSVKGKGGVFNFSKLPFGTYQLRNIDGAKDPITFELAQNRSLALVTLEFVEEGEGCVAGP